jgi:hypothetical protein
MPIRQISKSAWIIIVVIAIVWISFGWIKKENSASAVYLPYNPKSPQIGIAPTRIKSEGSVGTNNSAQPNSDPTPTTAPSPTQLTQRPSPKINELAPPDNSPLDTFNDYDETQKLELIANLPAHPGNPALLREILLSEQSAAVKIGVIGHLQELDGPDAKNLLIAALDDKTDAVAVIALNSLATKADESMVARLIEKMHSLPDGTLKNFYNESIERIQTRLTFGHSDLTQQ